MKYLFEITFFVQNETRKGLHYYDGMCWHNIAIQRREPEPEVEDDDLVELQDGEEYFEREERDGVTAKDYTSIWSLPCMWYLVCMYLVCMYLVCMWWAVTLLLDLIFMS